MAGEGVTYALPPHEGKIDFTAERDGLAMLRQRYGDAVLIEATLPSRAAVKKAVAARKPVWHSTQGGGHLAAGKEWRAACRLILKRVK